MSRRAETLFLLLFSCCTGSPSDAVPIPAEQPAPRTAAPPPPPVGAESEPARLPADLEQMGGDLRVIVLDSSLAASVHDGSVSGLDRRAVARLADSLGLRVRYVHVQHARELLPALRDGKGDIVGESLVVGDEPGVTFAAPLRHVGLVVAVRKGERATPRRVMSPALPPAATALIKKYAVVQAPDGMDAEELLARVGSGEVSAAVVRSDDLAAYRAYAQDVEPLAKVSEKLPVAWAMRPSAAKLKAAASALVYEEALTLHRQSVGGGDLAQILRRKAIRVAMLNNTASYFIYRGQEVGFQYDLAALFASRLALRLEVVVPDRPNQMRELLESGEADLVPISLADGQSAAGLLLSEPFSVADLVLVQPAGEPPITSVEGLSGKSVHARASSVYWPILAALKERVPGLTLVAASEELETEELIDQVGKKEIPLTAANSLLLGAEMTYRNDVQGTLELREHQALVYGMRPQAVKLKERVDALIRRELAGEAYKALWQKYFADTTRMAELHAAESSTSGAISPYDDLARRYGTEFGVDWRLVLAQMYQESRFDPKARSWAGALGLMQLMPNTASELGVRDLRDPEQNVRGGVRYLARLIGRFDAALPLQQRVRLALAAYNAGFEHVQDARILARQRGLDPDRWFGQVEKAMLLLEKPQFYRKARRGFCRGREPVAYVSRIQTKYDAYSALVAASSTASAP